MEKGLVHVSDFSYVKHRQELTCYKSELNHPMGPRATYFSLFQNVQAGSGIPQASYSKGNEVLFLGEKRSERDVHNSLASSAEVNKWSCISTAL